MTVQNGLTICLIIWSFWIIERSQIITEIFGIFQFGGSKTLWFSRSCSCSAYNAGAPTVKFVLSWFLLLHKRFAACWLSQSDQIPSATYLNHLLNTFELVAHFFHAFEMHLHLRVWNRCIRYCWQLDGRSARSYIGLWWALSLKTHSRLDFFIKNPWPELMIKCWNRDGSVVQDLIVTNCSLNVIKITSNLSRFVLKPLMYSWAFARFLDSSISLVMWLTGGMYCPSYKGLLAILTKKSRTLSLYISVLSTRSSEWWDDYSFSLREICSTPTLSWVIITSKTHTSRMCVD